MPSLLAFDTLAYSKALQNAGMEPALADLISSKQREAIADILDSRQLATKQDVQLEIEKVRAEIEKLRAESKADIEKLRADSEKAHGELRLEIEKVRAEITRSSHQKLKWQIATILGVIALLIRVFHLFGF